MKMNTFVVFPTGEKLSGNAPHSSVLGETVFGPRCAEDELIESIDEEIIIKKFLEFLVNCGYDWESFQFLSKTEQNKLKTEFFRDV
jgi:hypothetical protein